MYTCVVFRPCKTELAAGNQGHPIRHGQCTTGIDGKVAASRLDVVRDVMLDQSVAVADRVCMRFAESAAAVSLTAFFRSMARVST